MRLGITDGAEEVFAVNFRSLKWDASCSMPNENVVFFILTAGGRLFQSVLFPFLLSHVLSRRIV